MGALLRAARARQSGYSHCTRHASTTADVVEAVAELSSTPGAIFGGCCASRNCCSAVASSVAALE